MECSSMGQDTRFALQVQNLHKVYSNGKSALDGVNLNVPKGAFYALLGPNGAGKSTLINILADIVRPTAGSASLLGHDVFHDKAWCKRHMGVVPQEIALDPFFTPREVLAITSGLFGCKPDNAWIDELLGRLELSEHANRNARQLSGGMRRRLLVAQALVHKPPLVILDEPTAGVDVELRRRLWDFMRELNAAGTTILLTTHYLEEAEELCDYVTIIDQGRVVADRPMRELMRDVAGRYLWLRYGEGFTMSDEDARALVDFQPRASDRGVCLTLRHGKPDETNFHEAYQAAVSRFGAPVDAGVRQEDLEDVFIRLTHDDTNDKQQGDRT
ncbi:MAG: ABC transporter ATP-binding protein [Mariprofundaceae bacterium]|nr:ABC transporter ATP-binding protein [Mariprofundaceae bacterium]